MHSRPAWRRGMAALRVLELYSGIGGMHQALRESRVPAQVVAAVDVNTVANEVYRHNFPHTQLLAKTIEGITLEEFDRFSFDMILLSPPCQPFTRIGLQGDVTDPRTKSFLYFLDILPRLKNLPKYILLENVKGFEVSSTRDLLIQTIENCGFQYQEFLLSPTSLGIPNSRLRYFLLAKLQAEPLSFHAPGQILMEFPRTESEQPPQPACDAAEKTDFRGPCRPGASSSRSPERGPVLFKLETARELERKRQQDGDLSVRTLGEFLEGDADLTPYVLPPEALLRYALLLDIVRPTCRRSTCFTKGPLSHVCHVLCSVVWLSCTSLLVASTVTQARSELFTSRAASYGRYVEGTGSVLQTTEDVQIEEIYKSLPTLSQEEKTARLLMLKLRYFTPKEIANLLGFPPQFGFPEKISVKQRYRLLGNSLNVLVVAKLIKILCE